MGDGTARVIAQGMIHAEDHSESKAVIYALIEEVERLLGILDEMSGGSYWDRLENLIRGQSQV